MYAYSLLLVATTAFFMQAGVSGVAQAPVDLEAHAPTSLRSATSCAFQAPAPILLPTSYPGQTLERQNGNRVTETAALDKDLRIEIRQSACVDFLTTEFTLISSDQSLQLDHDGWIELARTILAGLKTRKPAGEYAAMLDFLKRARGLRPQDGILGSCRDGSVARPGECSWESLGGFVFSTKRTEHGARISVTQYLSG